MTDCKPWREEHNNDYHDFIYYTVYLVKHVNVDLDNLLKSEHPDDSVSSMYTRVCVCVLCGHIKTINNDLRKVIS